MEAKLVMRHVVTPGVSRRGNMPNRRYSPYILSVMAKPTDTSVTTSNTTNYKDNWFDLIAINHLSHSLQATIDFDDMSCEMIFGQEPPATTDDPAFKQACYKLCNEKQKHRTNLTS